jgi:competence protein ComEA
MLKKILALVAMLYAAACFAAVDVNKATAAELDSIKGIGPAISTKILDERKKGNYKDWNDLITRVQGVGDTNAAKFSAEGLTVNGTGFKGAAAAAPAKKDDKPAAAMPAKAEDKKAEAKPAAAPAAAAAPAKEAKADPKAEAAAKKEADKKAKDDGKTKKADDAKAKDAKKDEKPAAKSADAAKPAASAASAAKK